MAIFIYNRIPAKKIRREGKSTIKWVNEFFKLYPKRRTCRVQAWYNRIVIVHRNHVEEDMQSAIEFAIKGK